MNKTTRYYYRKQRTITPVQQKEITRVQHSDHVTDESEENWKLRLKRYGITDTQIDAFVEVRSLEAFIDYCRDEGLEFADIAGKRLISNRA